MTTLEQIDALPEWPKRAEYIAHHEAQGTMVVEPGDYWHDAHEAALARLTLAREWIANARHHDNCNVVRGDEVCICGRDALRKILEETT